jgi:hypothetical protein
LKSIAFHIYLDQNGEEQAYQGRSSER